jgi:hypothetical protein
MFDDCACSAAQLEVYSQHFEIPLPPRGVKIRENNLGERLTPQIISLLN